jgi:hypothetical protein
MCFCNGNIENNDDIDMYNIFKNNSEKICREYIKNNNTLRDDWYIYYDLSLNAPVVFHNEELSLHKRRDLHVLYKISELR